VSFEKVLCFSPLRDADNGEQRLLCGHEEQAPLGDSPWRQTPTYTQAAGLRWGLSLRLADTRMASCWLQKL